MNKSIELRGVRQNNLKNIDVDIELGSLTVICGPSGSGKSSLAFETLFAEGQRRYIESLSNYTKQFLNKSPKPLLDSIKNIPPAIAIEQKNGVKSSRSTVGTTTEVVDHLRLLFEKIGQSYCPEHKVAHEQFSPSTAAARLVKDFEGHRGHLVALISKKNRPLKEDLLFKAIREDGYSRILTQELEALDLLDPKVQKKGLPKADFYLVIDRVQVNEKNQNRLTDSFIQAFSASVKYDLNLESARVEFISTEGTRFLFSESPACPICAHQGPRITASLFSFNSPIGACEECKGFGNVLELDEAKVIPNPELTLARGAIAPFAMPSASQDRKELKAFCKKADIDLHTPYKDLPASTKKMLWEGTETFYGVLGLFEYLETKKYKMHVRVFLSRFKSPFSCSSCSGTRLKTEAHQVLVAGQTISELTKLTIEQLNQQITTLKLSATQQVICKEPIRQILERLKYLLNVGLGYLTLDRPTRTLSGGEFQRLSLANQLGAGLSQTLYVLDEPTIGLHPRDNERLIEVLKGLRDLGNTLVVVEHDQDMIRASSHVVEMGPASGERGGEALFSGTQRDFFCSASSLTLPYLLNKGSLFEPINYRPEAKKAALKRLRLSGCRGHNLKNVDIEIPLQRLVGISGVSGSGKSSLISDTLYPALARKLGLDFLPAGEFKSLEGSELIKNLVFLDQTSIGKNSRSNPVTYLKIYDAIRSLMITSPEAKSRGYTAGTFSLNVDGGRCPSCKGLGVEVIDMMFMDDIEMTCDSCQGRRFRSEVLEITYQNKNIYEILQLTVAEAMDFFVTHPAIRRALTVLKEVGLDYLKLGQPANTLSGGEAQRLKLCKELTSAQQKDTLYLLDEPSTGLHFREVQLLLNVLHKLVDAGSTVVLIEHNMEILRQCDYLVDLGPEAGDQGGQIVDAGSPIDLVRHGVGHTAKFLRRYFGELNLSVGGENQRELTQ